jgi:hypothetical protein
MKRGPAPMTAVRQHCDFVPLHKEGAMPERQQPDRDPGPAPQGASMDDLPEIETPVIRSQDIEHQARPDTRVNNSGLKIGPQSDEQRRKDDAQFAKEDEKAREAVAEFERSLADLPPD